MYGSTEKTYKIPDFFPLTNGWNLLKDYRNLPKELWQKIWNEIISPESIQFNKVHYKYYVKILKLGLTCKDLYNEFQIVRIKIIREKLRTLAEIRNLNNKYSQLLIYTKLLETCKTSNDNTLIVNNIFKYHRGKFQLTLHNYKDRFPTKQDYN